jgi:hypothetical protein
MADISIKGDAYLQYADMSTNVNGSNTENRKRINLNVIGKSGATTVVASFKHLILIHSCSMHPNQLYCRNHPL